LPPGKARSARVCTSRPWRSSRVSRTRVSRGRVNATRKVPTAGFGVTGANSRFPEATGGTPTVDEVVNRQVGPVVVMPPSLTVTYHSYWVSGSRLVQGKDAMEPDGAVALPR